MQLFGDKKCAILSNIKLLFQVWLFGFFEPLIKRILMEDKFYIKSSF